MQLPRVAMQPLRHVALRCVVLAVAAAACAADTHRHDATAVVSASSSSGGGRAKPPGAADAPVLLRPADGARVLTPHPHFAWSAPGGVPQTHTVDRARGTVATPPDTTVQLRLAGAGGRCDFARAGGLDDAVPAVLSRFVPRAPLPPNTTWCWRVRAGEAQAWSAAFTFTVATPDGVIVDVLLDASWEGVQAAFARAAAAGGNAVVRFEPGKRTLSPPPANGSGSSQVFLQLTAVSDVHVDGGGSAVTFDAPVTFVLLVNCSNVVVSGFTFDIDPLPYTAVAFVGDSGPKGAAFVELAAGHPPLESNPKFETNGIAEVMTPADRSVDGQPVTKRGVSEVMHYGNVNRVPGSNPPRYKVELKGWAGRDALGAGVKRGDVLVIDPRIDPGFLVYGSSEVTLTSVVVTACANECFTSELSDALSILDCGTRLAPGRFLAANNGGHNHHGARVGQWVEGGLWENAGDDTIHVSGLVDAVAEVHSPTDITIVGSGGLHRYAALYSDGDLGIAAGDLLQFFNHVTGAVVSERLVTAVASVSRQRGTRVTLSGPVGPVVTGATRGKGGGLNSTVTQVFNFNRTSNEFVFRSNTVRNGRRVGVLYKGYRAWIGNNTFVGLGGGALESWNAPFEGLCSQSVVFRGNTVTDVCQLARTAAPVWTQRLADRPPPDAPTCHRDYLIANNTFDSGPGPAALLDDVADAAVVGNAFTLCAGDAVVNASANAVVSGYYYDDASNTVTRSRDPRVCDK